MTTLLWGQIGFSLLNFIFCLATTILALKRKDYTMFNEKDFYLFCLFLCCTGVFATIFVTYLFIITGQEEHSYNNHPDPRKIKRYKRKKRLI